ncbi:unnamed protein product [Cochlearia groenlandica]
MDEQDTHRRSLTCVAIRSSINVTTEILFGFNSMILLISTYLLNGLLLPRIIQFGLILRRFSLDEPDPDETRFDKEETDEFRDEKKEKKSRVL